MRRFRLLLAVCLLAAACSESDFGDDVASATSEPEATVAQADQTSDESGDGVSAPEPTLAEGQSAEPEATESPASEPTPGVEITDDQEVAWPASETKRDIENFVAALAAGAFDQAAWPAENNGIVLEGQSADESVVAYLERLCDDGRCQGPYLINAMTPGLVDPETSQASAEAVVTHVDSGEKAWMTLFTFEGQRVIASLPPLVASERSASLPVRLFGDRPPGTIVVQRFDAFETWHGDSSSAQVDWVTHWRADEAIGIEGDFVATRTGVAGLSEPTQEPEIGCASLLERDGAVLALDLCSNEPWDVTNLASGEPAEALIPWEPPGEASSPWYAERGGRAVSGVRDAEGNLVELTSASGTDLLGDDYAGLLAISTDGAHVAYVDHADPAAYSHFWSPVVVVRDAASGDEIDRFSLDGAVICLEFAVNWIVACEADNNTLPSGSPEQQSLAAVDLTTGTVNRVETATRLFLPATSPFDG